jgi:hypothetical protein
MNNIFKFTTASILACSISFTAFCNTSEIGTYTNPKDPKELIELHKDGTFANTEYNKTSGEYSSYAGKYRVDGKKLTLELPSGMTATGSIDGNVITDPAGIELIKK